MMRREDYFCWLCNSKLHLKRTKDGSYGLYCVVCCRFRKFKVEVPLEIRGGWSRVDVRRMHSLGICFYSTYEELKLLRSATL